METGDKLVLSLTWCLFANTSASAVTLSRPPFRTVRTDRLGPWPHSLSPRCRGNGSKITWLPCHAGHELLQRFNAQVFISIPVCSTAVKPGVNPRCHVTTNRKWGINSLHNNSMASLKFMPTDSHSSLYGGSILSTCAWYEDGAAVQLFLSTQALSCPCFNDYNCGLYFIFIYFILSLKGILCWFVD